MTPAVRQILADSWRKGAGLRLDFANDRYFQQGVGSGIDLISVSRASTGTDLLPSSPSGASYLTFAANTPRRSALAGGLLVEEARTQLSAFPAAPQNETITIGATGTYTLWVNGSGSAAVAAGTAVGSGFGTATNGTPVVFAISTIGTVGITVTGSLQALQVEAGQFGTSLIPQAATTRAADAVTVRSIPSLGPAYTLFGSGIALAPASYTAGQTLASITDGTTSNRAQIGRASVSGNASAIIVAGGVAQYNRSISSIVTGAVIRMGLALQAGDQEAYTNGIGLIGGTDNGPTMPSGITTVALGNVASVAFWNGVVCEVAIWPTSRLSDSDLQRFTAS